MDVRSAARRAGGGLVQCRHGWQEGAEDERIVGRAFVLAAHASGMREEKETERARESERGEGRPGGDRVPELKQVCMIIYTDNKLY